MEDDFNESEFFSPVGSPKDGKVNPLKRFMVGAVDVPLPTKGRFYPWFNPTMAGNVTVTPIRPHEQLLLKSPDSLFSGQAVEQIIRHSVQGIANPREVSIPDLDVLLLAIRAASGEDVIKVETKCPKCEHETVEEVSIKAAMAAMTFTDEDNSVRINDQIVAYVRPLNLQTATKISLTQYEEVSKISAADPEITEKEYSAMRQAMQNALIAVSLDSVIESVLYIETPDGPVYEREFIDEFVRTDANIYRMLDKKITELGKSGVFKEGLALKCEKCEHEWTTEMVIDPSSFFDPNS